MGGFQGESDFGGIESGFSAGAIGDQEWVVERKRLYGHAKSCDETYPISLSLKLVSCT
jgi:hypothetical protein